MRAQRASEERPSTRRCCRAIVTLCALFGAVAVVLLSSCTGGREQATQPRDDDVVIESDRAYLRLPPQLMGAELEVEPVGTQLVRCYELQASGGAWDITYVNLELVLRGNQFRAQVGQGHTNLSDTFTSCIDQATMGWHFDSNVNHEGDIIPLEFGPASETPTP